MENNYSVETNLKCLESFSYFYHWSTLDEKYLNAKHLWGTGTLLHDTSLVMISTVNSAVELLSVLISSCG